VLNSDRSQLPNLQLVLGHLYNLANSNTQTRSMNLREIPESERFDWDAPPRFKNSLEMWQTYSKTPSNIRLNPQVCISACVKALVAGYTKRAVLSMLEHDPQYQNLQRVYPTNASKYTEQIVAAAETEFLRPIRSLVSISGTSQADGSRMIITDNHQIFAKNESLQVLRTSTGECILNVEGKSISNDMNHKDIRQLYSSSQSVKQLVEADRTKNQRANNKDLDRDMER
jgi:hypothetical protein